ncbi:filamentous hemagglutinin N-terminal domain-containing protein [Pseudomonas sp. UL073]|uniref:Filamentous hemagglutinin N-terminal domain-containing protein n=1 Tax=Zestomonas insulae TaxID=2809017 RepID=A0ABS2IE21_9GAMM|nr:MBG domain-containing protein [Pseudomonas insulae]MBM7061285.1 filamentous hemagglutinin N-terminal domain-containing protein [Pseudomonas insulae]
MNTRIQSRACVARRSRSGKPGRGSLKPLYLCVALALLGGFVAALPAGADELPSGGTISHGSGSITPTGPDLNVTTDAPRTVINWDRFSIGPDNKVHFQQPDGSSVTLNRVIGGQRSDIMGVLSSNGRLILVNPAGIWFGQHARITTSSLLAAAGAISDEELAKFKRGEKFDIDLKGLVRNDGTIQLLNDAQGNNTLGDKGLVALLGAQVENHGVIQARKGKVVMASGPKATLDFTGDGLISLVIGGDAASNPVNDEVTGGVHNSGHIDVGNGVVVMSAQRAAKHLDSVINLGGAVVADSVTEKGGQIVLGNAEHTNVSGSLSAKGDDGGSIKVLGEHVTVAGSATLDASGSTGKGGSVLVGGSYQGKGSEPAAQSTTVEKGAQLKADGKTDGGLIVAWSDGQTQFAGHASAKGGERGGVVETSGQQLSISGDAKVDVSGGKNGGTWLLDPAIIDIDENAAQAIVTTLASGNVRVEASERINVNAPIVASNIGQVLGADGQPTGATLALIANGKVGTITSYDAATGDKHNDSGSVYINAPILLKDGNLFISATGDVRLVDNATNGETGAAAWRKRAIVDVGAGIAWIKTSNTATVSQDANTALIADKLAVQGASVRLNSALNYAGTLTAGQASNGVFQFNQANASGSTVTGKVTNPFSGESMDGVKAQQIRYVGSQDIVADPTTNGFTDPYRSYELKYGNEQFDYLVFEAIGFVDQNHNPIPPAELLNYLDSSDYLVHGLSFTDSGNVQWRLAPNKANANLTDVYKDGVLQSGAISLGFSFDAHKGMVVVSDVPVPNGENGGWGVGEFTGPGPLNPGELQHSNQTGSSEQLVVGLGDKVSSVMAQLGWLMDDRPWIQTQNGQAVTAAQLLERARVHFLATQDAPDGAVSLTAQQATLSAQVDNAQRSYGDANPSFTTQATLNDKAQAVREVDQFVDAELGRSGISAGAASSSATAASNVGSYAIQHGYKLDTFAGKRYEATLGNATLTIIPVELVVQADDKAKQVGEADPALTYQYQSGLKNNDALGEVLNQGGATRQPGEAPGVYAIGQGNVALNSVGTTADGQPIYNYTLTFLPGKLTIAGPVGPDPVTPDPVGPDPVNPPPIVPEPVVSPSASPGVNNAAAVQGPGSERCSALESPAAVSANYSVSPAVQRTYTVQLVCKPRAYDHGTAKEEAPNVADILGYANSLLKDGRFQIPDWNRSVIPRELIEPRDQDKQ